MKSNNSTKFVNYVIDRMIEDTIKLSNMALACMDAFPKNSPTYKYSKDLYDSLDSHMSRMINFAEELRKES